MRHHLIGIFILSFWVLPHPTVWGMILNCLIHQNWVPYSHLKSLRRVFFYLHKITGWGGHLKLPQYTDNVSKCYDCVMQESLQGKGHPIERWFCDNAPWGPGTLGPHRWLSGNWLSHPTVGACPSTHSGPNKNKIHYYKILFLLVII